MKKITELRFEEMTTEQKIGFVMVGGSWRPILQDEEDLNFVLGLIKKRALGALWVSCHSGENRDFAKVTKLIRETADYPILILTDEESGFGDYRIGHPIALGYLQDERAAYAYGKAIAVQSRKCGYNVVCNPLLDRKQRNVPCGGVLRQLHPDKEISARLAEALCRGMHDGGVLTCAKHFPSAPGIPIDSHMAEVYSDETREKVVNEWLYAYKYLCDRGLIDAVMAGHMCYVNIDPDYPASLSEKLCDILRGDIGFDGPVVTDSLTMMGVVARFGEDLPRWKCIEAGYDLSLGFGEKTRFTFESLMEAYRCGKLSQEKLDSAVRRVLALQHRALQMMEAPACTSLTGEEDRLAREINAQSIAAITDEGVETALPTDGRYLFVLMSEKQTDLDAPVENDTMSSRWYEPNRIAAKIRKLFPKSGVTQIGEYPDVHALSAVCRERLDYEGVVMVTYFENAPYIGREAFTPRIVSLVEAWQMSHAIQAIVHFGNPYVLEELSHIPRIISACKSLDCTEYAVEVLAGVRKPQGKMPFALKLQ